MTWKEAKKLFQIEVSVEVYQHPHLGKEVVIHSKKLGWKSRYAYAIDVEHLMVGVQTLVIPSSEVIRKLEQYLGEEIIFQEGDTLKNIINEQQNESIERNAKTRSNY